MDWQSFRNLVNENLPELFRWLITILNAIVVWIVVIIRTRTKAILKKANVSTEDIAKGINLDDYVVEIGDASYDLNQLNIKKRRK